MIIKITPEILKENMLTKKEVTQLCTASFYKHPKGCPNYNKKEGCPPNQPLIDEILDFQRDLFAIYTEFNVGEFAEKIKSAHPDWKSPRQWYNPRYWQPKARKFQRQEEKNAKEEYSLDVILNSPEANGLNVTGLMKEIGIAMKWNWPPEHNTENKEYLKNSVYLISLGGFALDNNERHNEKYER